MRLRWKLIAGQLVVVSSLWVVASYAERESMAALEQLLIDRVADQAGDVWDEVQDELQARILGLKSFVSDPTFQRGINESNARFERTDDPEQLVDERDDAWRKAPKGSPSALMLELSSNEQAEQLRAYMRSLEVTHGYAVLGELFVTNRFGGNVAQTGRTSDYRQSDEEWWQLARERGVYVTDAELDESSGVVSTDVCIRVDDPSGTFLGVLKAVLDVQGVYRLLDKRSRGSDVRFTLFTADNSILYSTRHGNAPSFEMPPTHECEEDRSVDVLGVSSRAGTNVVSAIVRGEGPTKLGWALLAEHPTDKVLLPANRLGRSIVLVAVVVTAVALFLGVVFAFWISRRVDSLAFAIRRIRQGDLDVCIDNVKGGEFGELAESFNEMTAALRNAKAEAESARIAKTAFLANMSHEIRTPMTAVVACADLLSQDEQDAQERQRHIQTIRSSSQHLMALINNILDLSKIEAGKLEVSRIECSVGTLLSEVIDLMANQAAAKGIELSAVLKTPIPETIESDPTRLRQVLVNLVGNAVKFTDNGFVRLEVTLVEGAERFLEFAVVDSGIGLDEQVRERILRPFEQADSSTTRRFGGTGLGLAISRQLLVALGGRLEIESEKGVGSTFRGTVSIGACEQVPMLRSLDEVVANWIRRSSDAIPRVDGARVLLAEDVRVNQRLMSTMLTQAGARVTVANDGEEAVEKALDEGPFDVILMDLMMPTLDGYGATQKLRAAGYGGEIVAITADALIETKKRCLAEGFDGFVTKPITKAKLCRAVAARLPEGSSLA